MFPGVSIPVRFLNLTSLGGGGPSKEDRLGGASRPSRSGSGGIVCVGIVLSGRILVQVSELELEGGVGESSRVVIPRLLILLKGAGQLGGL